MSFLPNISKKKKSTKFNSPLAGEVFDNFKFLKDSHINLVDNQHENTQISEPPRYHRKSNSVVYYPDSISPPKSKIVRDCSFFRQSTISQDYETISRRSFSITPSRLANIKKKSIFPTVEVKALNEVEKEKIQQKSITVNLGCFFINFFRTKNLPEEDLDQQFLTFAEEQIRGLIKEDKLKKDLNLSEFPEQFLHLRNKQEIMEKVKSFEKKNRKKQIEAIIRFYCVPSKEYQNSALRDLVMMIKRQFDKSYDFRKNENYILLNENGIIVNNIVEIFFSTTLLYLCPEQKFSFLYRTYRNHCLKTNSITNKINFNFGLKNSFRKDITKGNYETYTKDYQTIRTDFQKRKQAETIINLRRSQKALKLYKPEPTKNSKATKVNPRKKQSTLQMIPKSKSKKQEEFRKLVKENEEGIRMYTYLSKSPLFKNKSEDHQKKILNAIGLSIEDEFIFEDDWMRLNEISECLGKKQIIMLFLKQFMGFSSNFRIRKSHFENLMRIIRPQKDRKELSEVIWLWFEKNKLVEEQFILGRDIFEEWKEKNKFIIECFISLIFGIKEMNFIQLTYQVLI